MSLDRRAQFRAPQSQGRPVPDDRGHARSRAPEGGRALVAAGHPIPLAAFPPPHDFQALCKAGGRFGAHNIQMNRPATTSRTLTETVVGCFFNGGVRACSIADPYRPMEIGYLVDAAAAGPVRGAGQPGHRRFVRGRTQEVGRRVAGVIGEGQRQLGRRGHMPLSRGRAGRLKGGRRAVGLDQGGNRCCRCGSFPAYLSPRKLRRRDAEKIAALVANSVGQEPRG